MSSYQALREGAAWIGLPRRGRIRATGEDRLRLLHAMSSNAVEDLKPGEGVRAYFLNAHGHILADTRIWAFEDSTLLDTEPETRQSLAEHLEKYIIMDDVTLEDVTDSMAAVAVEGPQATAIVAKQVGAAPESGEHHLASSGVTVVATSATGQPGCWLLAEAGEESELIRRLEAAGGGLPPHPRMPRRCEWKMELSGIRKTSSIRPFRRSPGKWARFRLQRAVIWARRSSNGYARGER